MKATGRYTRRMADKVERSAVIGLAQWGKVTEPDEPTRRLTS
jgi:hypothetical protein